ncbi:MAG: DUF2812 domain-containing protein [Clostridiaceae bacterium]|nr:DUF2812 domain-containing protein [Clostridiaceae bacterium]
MDKSYFKPFWSYDVPKTEKWLSTMASKGYHLLDVNFKLRIFKFSFNEPKTVVYRITYSKFEEKNLPTGLLLSSWGIQVSNKHWCIMINQNPLSNILNFPARNGILKRNRTIMYVVGIGLWILTVLNSLNVIVAGYIVILLLSASIATAIYTFVKLYLTNKKLRVEVGMIPNSSFYIPIDKLYDKKTGQVITKWKIAWYYSPDRIETWLENMEIQGFNLYGLSNLGSTFNFIKEEPRKIKYCTDFQNNASEDYYEFHKQAGWQLIFTSPFGWQKWTLWSKEYKESETKPELYSNKTDVLKHAKKVAVTFSLMFLPLLLIYLALIVFFILLNNRANPIPPILWMNVFISLIPIIEFGSFSLRAILYYFRLKKKYN